MSSFSLNENVLNAALNGDRTAMNELVAVFAPVVESIASAFAGRCPLTRSDLIQEGMLGLLSSVYGYDSSKGAAFKTYASKCISNSIAGAVRSQLRAKHMPLNGYVSLDSLEAAGGFTADPQATVDMQERMNLIYEKIRNELTPLERNVLGLHIAGHDYNTIAERLSVSAKVVDNALQRARKKLKEK